MAVNRSSPAAADLEVARAVVASFANGGSESAEELCHPDLAFHDAWGVGAGMYRGLAGMRQLHEDFATAWEEFSFELREIEPTPDGRVFLGLTHRTRRKSTSRTVERTMYFVLAFRDGKLLSWDGWHLRDVARGAAGLAD